MIRSLLFLENFDLIDATRASYDSIIFKIPALEHILRKGSSIDVGNFVLLVIVAPSDSLPHGELVVVPYLDLILCSITSYQNFAIIVIDRIACDVGTKDRSHAFTLPHVPEMDHGVPTTRNDCVLIDEFEREDAVGMPPIVPLRTFQISRYTLIIYLDPWVL